MEIEMSMLPELLALLSGLPGDAPDIIRRSANAD